MKKYLTKTEIAVGSSVALLFLLTSYFSTTYKDVLQELAGIQGIYGMVIYVVITIIVVVFAPISTIPMLPIAAAAWGSFITSILSVLGWTIGAVISFWIARRFGHPFIKKFASLQKVQSYGERIPATHLFWSVVFLRVVMPVDVLSYALGLFSKMTLWSYILATLIGITPFAFIFSYTATLPMRYQIGALILSGLVIVLGYKKVKSGINEDN